MKMIHNHLTDLKVFLHSIFGFLGIEMLKQFDFGIITNIIQLLIGIATVVYISLKIVNLRLDIRHKRKKNNE